jgi:hypothetical protein
VTTNDSPIFLLSGIYVGLSKIQSSILVKNLPAMELCVVTNGLLIWY